MTSERRKKLEAKADLIKEALTKCPEERNAALKELGVISLSEARRITHQVWVHEKNNSG